MERPKLVSSNPKKLEEFRRFGLDMEIERGVDLKEVDGTPLDVILHKAKDAGANRVVEDTILVVDGKPVVDVRWKLDELAGRKAEARWIVHLGYNDGKSVRVYKGEVDGHLDGGAGESDFGFDGYFVPEGQDVTLEVLKKVGRKDEFSARRMAADRLMANAYYYIVDLKDIGEWEGDYQN